MPSPKKAKGDAEAVVVAEVVPSKKPGKAQVVQARAKATREGILKAAIRIFSKKGFDGARIETISKAAGTHDRMLYYYFESKERLFVEVLEAVYLRMNAAEAALKLDYDQPVEALTKLVEFRWNYYLANPDFITLLNSENMHQGKHFKKASPHAETFPPTISMLDTLLKSGNEKGIFSTTISAVDLYILISSMGYFYVANHFTLGAFLHEDMMEKDRLSGWSGTIVNTVLRAVGAEVAGPHRSSL